MSVKAKQGAAILSWEAPYLRETLKRLMDENPKAKKEAVFRLLLKEWNKADEPGTVDYGLVIYWFSNAWNAMTRVPYKASEEERLATAREARALVHQTIVHSMYKLTFGQLAKISAQGAKISKLGKPRELVAKRFTLDEFEKLLRTT